MIELNLKFSEEYNMESHIILIKVMKMKKIIEMHHLKNIDFNNIVFLGNLRPS